jgi:hypothetical protein
VLHTRNLCDFCTSTDPRNIRPCDLFDAYDTDSKYDTLKELMNRLTKEYGFNNEGDVRWAFNKMLAHPTQKRGEGFDYGPYLDRVLPVIEQIVSVIETLRGHPFPDLPAIYFDVSTNGTGTAALNVNYTLTGAAMIQPTPAKTRQVAEPNKGKGGGETSDRALPAGLPAFTNGRLRIGSRDTE